MESTFGNSRPVALVVGSDGQFAIKLVELFVEVDAYLLQTLIRPVFLNMANLSSGSEKGLNSFPASRTVTSNFFASMWAAIAPPAPLPITMTFFILLLINSELRSAAITALGYALTELQVFSRQARNAANDSAVEG